MLYQRWICDCCYQVLATGDTSACEHYYDHIAKDHPASLVGEFDGLDLRLGEEELEIPAHSYRDCDGCGGEVLAFGILHEVLYTR